MQPLGTPEFIRHKITSATVLKHYEKMLSTSAVGLYCLSFKGL